MLLFQVSSLVAFFKEMGTQGKAGVFSPSQLFAQVLIMRRNHDGLDIVHKSLRAESYRAFWALGQVAGRPLDVPPIAMDCQSCSAGTAIFAELAMSHFRRSGSGPSGASLAARPIP